MLAMSTVELGLPGADSRHVGTSVTGDRDSLSRASMHHTSTPTLEDP